MKKLIVLGTLTMLFLGLFLYANYWYYNEPKAVATPVVSQKVYNAAITTMKLHDTVNEGVIASKNQQVTDTASKNTQLCTFIKSKKLTVDPKLCL